MEIFDKIKASVASRPCPVCGSAAIKGVLVDRNIDWKNLNEFAFSSRKNPELMSWRMVCCADCDVAYAAEVPAASALVDAYHVADYDSSEEADYAAASYAKELGPLVQKLPRRRGALEIGAGNGSFLAQLVKMGFKDVVGFEPSKAALALARPDIAPLLREGIMEAAELPPESFDFVGCFQTMEHVRDPLQIARDVYSLLREGGMVAFIDHDYRSLLNRLLGRRSPIIDVEHLQLFSQPSMRRLLEETGFSEIVVTSFWNRYPLRYWLRLLPLSAGAKKSLIRALDQIGLGGVTLSANVGNMIGVGYKRFK